jgi:hypothetical protein
VSVAESFKISETTVALEYQTSMKIVSYIAITMFSIQCIAISYYFDQTFTIVEKGYQIQARVFRTYRSPWSGKMTNRFSRCLGDVSVNYK